MNSIHSNQFLSPKEIAGQFSSGGIFKSNMTTLRFSVYAIMGGAFIALGGLLSLLVAGGMPGIAAANPGLVKFVAGAMFPFGLILVVIAGGGLFTSDCAVLPFAYWNKEISKRSILKIATIGYFANFVGAVLVAWLLAVQTGTLTSDPWRSAAILLAENKTQASFLTVFAKGIGANLLVCMGVWMAYASKDITGKVIVIWVPVMAFVALGWEHSIANMFFIPLAMMMDANITIYDFVVANLIPATLGNIVGGMCMVALPYHYLFRSPSEMQPKSAKKIEKLINQESDNKKMSARLN